MVHANKRCDLTASKVTQFSVFLDLTCENQHRLPIDEMDAFEYLRLFLVWLLTVSARELFLYNQGWEVEEEQVSRPDFHNCEEYRVDGD